MVLWFRKKRPGILLAFFLVIAITGTFTFAAADTLLFGVLGAAAPVSGGLLTSMDYAIDWLSTEPVRIGRARGYATSPMRNGVPRICMAIKPQPIGGALVLSSLKAVIDIHCLEIKNVTPLKLLI